MSLQSLLILSHWAQGAENESHKPSTGSIKKNTALTTTQHNCFNQMVKFLDTGHEHLKGWNTPKCGWFFSEVKAYLTHGLLLELINYSSPWSRSEAETLSMLVPAGWFSLIWASNSLRSNHGASSFTSITWIDSTWVVECWGIPWSSATMVRLYLSCSSRSRGLRMEREPGEEGKRKTSVNLLQMASWSCALWLETCDRGQGAVLFYTMHICNISLCTHMPDTIIKPYLNVAGQVGCSAETRSSFVT